MTGRNDSDARTIWRRSQALLLLIAGFAVWSSGFVSLYALLSLGCRYGWTDVSWGGVQALRWILFAAWILHVAAICGLLAFLLTRLRRPADGEGHFLPAVTLALTAASLVAMIWTGAPHLFLQLCR